MSRWRTTFALYPNVHEGVLFLAADIFDECSGIEMDDKLKMCTSIVIAQKKHSHTSRPCEFEGECWSEFG